MLYGIDISVHSTRMFSSLYSGINENTSPGRGNLGSEHIASLAGTCPRCEEIVLVINVQVWGVPDGLELLFRLSHCVARNTRIMEQESGKEET